MNHVHLGWILVGMGLLACCALVPGSAGADMLRCESRSLDPGDEAALRARARGMLPTGMRFEVVDACRNPTAARAWITTRKRITADGIAQWWELSCRREAEIWGCEPPHFQQLYTLRLLLDHRQRDVALSFDRDTPLGEAQARATQALSIYLDPAARPAECVSGQPAESEWSKLRERSPLLGHEPIRVTITLDEGARSVMLEDVAVEFRFPLGTRDSSTGVGECWNQWVIVT